MFADGLNSRECKSVAIDESMAYKETVHVDRDGGLGVQELSRDNNHKNFEPVTINSENVIGESLGSFSNSSVPIVGEGDPCFVPTNILEVLKSSHGLGNFSRTDCNVMESLNKVCKGVMGKEQSIYCVDLPSEEEETCNNLALVPFNVQLALERLSLKRKMPNSSSEESRHKKLRGVGVSLSKEVRRGDGSEVSPCQVGVEQGPHVEKCLVKERKIRKWRTKKNRGSNWIDETKIVNVNIVVIDGPFDQGCGGWPLTVTKEK